MCVENLKENLSSNHEVLVVLVETLKDDLKKSLDGNKSAGTRLRKCLREIAKVSRDMNRSSLEMRKLTSDTKD